MRKDLTPFCNPLCTYTFSAPSTVVQVKIYYWHNILINIFFYRQITHLRDEKLNIKINL